MAFTHRLLPQTGNAHHEQTLGYDLGVQAVAHFEQFAALHQPGFQAFQSAHVAQIGAIGDELDHTAAIHQQPLLFQQRGQ